MITDISNLKNQLDAISDLLLIAERYHMKDFPEKTWLRDSDLKLNK